MNSKNYLLICVLLAVFFRGVASSGESNKDSLPIVQKTKILEDVRNEMVAKNEAGQLQTILLQWINSANTLRKMNTTQLTRESDILPHNLCMLHRALAPIFGKGNSIDAVFEGGLFSDIEEYKQSIRFFFAAKCLLEKHNTEVLEILSADSGNELSTNLDVLALWALMDTSLARLPSRFWTETKDSWHKMETGKNPLLRLLAVRYAKCYMTEKSELMAFYRKSLGEPYSIFKIEGLQGLASMKDSDATRIIAEYVASTTNDGTLPNGEDVVSSAKDLLRFVASVEVP